MSYTASSGFTSTFYSEYILSFSLHFTPRVDLWMYVLVDLSMHLCMYGEPNQRQSRQKKNRKKYFYFSFLLIVLVIVNSFPDTSLSKSSRPTTDYDSRLYESQKKYICMYNLERYNNRVVGTFLNPVVILLN